MTNKWCLRGQDNCGSLGPQPGKARTNPWGWGGCIICSARDCFGPNIGLIVPVQRMCLVPGAMRQRILGSHTPPCHRCMVITTQFNVLPCCTALVRGGGGGLGSGRQLPPQLTVGWRALGGVGVSEGLGGVAPGGSVGGGGGQVRRLGVVGGGGSRWGKLGC